MASSTAQRRLKSRHPKVTKSRTDELAERLASDLNISDTPINAASDVGGSKCKRRQTSAESTEERKIITMKNINTASQSLSSVVQSNWKSGMPRTGSGHTIASVSALASTARRSLKLLREPGFGNLDVERAASSIIGKLLAIEMYEHALQLLWDMHDPMICLYHTKSMHGVASKIPLLDEPPSQTQAIDHLPLLILPLPQSPVSLDAIMQSLISSYLTYALTVVSHYVAPQPTTHTSFLNAISSPGALISWISYLTDLPSKSIDSMLKRNYMMITNSFSSLVASPFIQLRVRLYALRSLLCSSVLDINSFWEQALRFGAVYVKATTNDGVGEKTNTTRDLLEYFQEIVDDTEKRQDKDQVMKGKGWIGFCEYWLCVAKKVGDHDLLSRTARYIQNSVPFQAVASLQGATTVSNSDNKPESSHFKTDDRALQVAKLCAAFLQTTVLLERLASGDSAVAEELQKCIETSRLSLPNCVGLLSTGSDVDALNHKVLRAVEKLRRAALKALDLISTDHETQCTTRKLLEVIVDFFQTILQTAKIPGKKADLSVGALDSLFKLASTILSPTNSDTWAPAYSYLSLASKIIMSSNPLSQVEGEKDLENYCRCISGAFFNLAGVLYKAGVYGSATRFLNDACTLGERALQMYYNGSGEKDPLKGKSKSVPDEEQDRDKDLWIQLRAQLYKRWELRGVCHLKVGDRRLAYESFVGGVERYPFKEEAEKLTKTIPFSDSFSNPNHEQLGSMIDRLTYIGAAELFLQGRVSLLDSLRSAGIPDICIGIVLERQIQGLDGSKWKPLIREVIQKLLDDLLAVYKIEHPVRRARVLIRRLEDAYFSETISLDPHSINEEVQSLLSGDDFGQDSALSSFRAQYLASSHLWLALYAYRRRSPENGVLILHNASEALNILHRSMISSAVPTPKKNPRRSVEADENQEKPTRKTATRMQRANSIKPIKKAPVTPRPRKVAKTQLPDAATPLKPNTTSTICQNVQVLDDFKGFTGLLQMVTQLLGLLGHVVIKMQLLIISRRLSEIYGGIQCDAYIRASVDLAHELVKIGKVERASSIYANMLASVRGLEPAVESDSTSVLFFLRYAELSAMLGNVAEGCTLYDEASMACDRLLSENKAATTSGRVRERVASLERTALAATVFAVIQQTRDGPTTALDGLLQALRLYNQASDTLAQLNKPSKPEQRFDTSNPFDMSDVEGALPSANSPTISRENISSQKTMYQRTPMDGFEWRIADGLFNTLFALSQAYFVQGSAREAEYFARQAETLADSLHVPAMISRALARKSEIQLHLGQLEDVRVNLVKASTLLKETPGTDAAEVRRLRGDHCYKHQQNTDAQNMYVEAMVMLGQLHTMFSTQDYLTNGSLSRKSNVLSPQSSAKHKDRDNFAPFILASILKQQIWLLRDDIGQEYEELLDRFIALPPSAEIQAEINALLGKLALHGIHGRFSADMFLSSLTESTIALPMGISGNTVMSQSSPTREILAALDKAENIFASGLDSFSRRGRVTYVRDSAVSLVLVRAFQTALGRVTEHGPSMAAGLLDMSSSITLRREMLEAIQYKFPDIRRREDLRWPSLSGSPAAVTGRNSPQRFDVSVDISVDSDEDDVSTNDTVMKKYWAFLLDKYKSQTFDVLDPASVGMSLIPDNWTVVNISVTDDKGTLLVSRQQPNREPMLFCVPLKGRRDSDDDEHLTFDGALAELTEIIDASHESTRQSAKIMPEDKEGKTAWWAERTLLDQRLKELLANIEFCWLGAFKTVLSQPMKTPPDVIPALRSRIEKVFKHVLGTQEKKLKTRLRLDDGLLECFAALPTTCRDEELEDLVYFVLDSYHFHGVPVALAEVDIDQVAVDLRTTLEEHHAKVKGRVLPENDGHVFLVLDKNVQCVPWESIPVLRGRSVSRIPSVSFLIDRLQLARCERGLPFAVSGNSGVAEKVDRARVDPSSGFYVLNPSGDLQGTEKRLSEWVKDMGKIGWQGIIGHQPSEQQLLDALERKDLVVYFGHGGAEQYIRSHKIRHLPRCAVTMLWGCSSGALRDMGDFDRVGTPYNYMMAGCPALVANIWDVTDRDIDKFSLSVFSKLHLDSAGVKQWRKDRKDAEERGTSLMAAVAQSRETCKLKYLTGAAPVVYGIPFYL